MQPIWKDEVYRQGGAFTGRIEVSSFQFILSPNSKKSGTFNRKILTEVLEVQRSANDIFAAQNAASGESGDVSNPYPEIADTCSLFCLLRVGSKELLLGAPINGKQSLFK